MEHIIYKITNTISGRFYIGMHSTKNVNDGYMGSGKRIKAEIKKYGKENFKKEILEMMASRELLEERESQLVNADLLSDPLCLNLKNGGEGGGQIWSAEHQEKLARAGGSVSGRKNQKLMITEEARAKANQTRKERSTHFTMGMVGKTHSAATKQQMSEAGSGSKNSQFGTCWINDGTKAIKIKKEQLAEYQLNGWKQGRKFLVRTT